MSRPSKTKANTATHRLTVAIFIYMLLYQRYLLHYWRESNTFGSAIRRPSFEKQQQRQCVHGATTMRRWRRREEKTNFLRNVLTASTTTLLPSSTKGKHFWTDFANSLHASAQPILSIVVNYAQVGLEKKSIWLGSLHKNNHLNSMFRHIFKITLQTECRRWYIVSVPLCYRL